MRRLTKLAIIELVCYSWLSELWSVWSSMLSDNGYQLSHHCHGFRLLFSQYERFSAS